MPLIMKQSVFDEHSKAVSATWGGETWLNAGLEAQGAELQSCTSCIADLPTDVNLRMSQVFLKTG